MGFIIWYKLEFRTSAKADPFLRLSNDVLQGDLTLDAAVATSATLGPFATEFTATLWDLPQENAKGLAERCRALVNTADPLLVDISLGYFDDSGTQRAPMMRGAITEIRTEVTADGRLLTQLKGRELAGYLLLLQPFSDHKAGKWKFDEVLTIIEKETAVEISHAGVTGVLNDFTIAAGTALGALGELAKKADTMLAVRAGKAVLGPVSAPAPPARFAAAENLVSIRRWDSGSPDAQAKPGSKTRYELTVLGDPTLQIGAQVLLEDQRAQKLRIESVRHSFSLRGGYTCELTVLDEAGTARPEAVGGVHGAIDGMVSLTRGLLADHPNVDVGDVASYRKAGEGDNGGHRATLNYGQRQAASSVNDPIDNRLLLHDKPLSSVFAWHRTGLMVPVYPGMRAVLVHNAGAVDDAIASGFLWSRSGEHEPPENEPGDYWLCLPTGVSGGKPAGKGVNDLTNASGHRVIQAAGLNIEVGAEVLPPVGDRPTPPSTQTLTIKHGKGTTITIAEDGAVGVDTAGKDIKLDNGKASIVLSGSDITMNAKNIKLSAESVDVG